MNTNTRKKKYISKALIILKREGLRLSLDEVANEMGKTKKTIYNHFSSKEELIKECLTSIMDDFQQAVNVLDNKEHSAIENLRTAISDINTLFTELSPMFFNDLLKLNPNRAKSEHIMGSELFKKKLEANLKQGIEEKVFRTDLDVDFICRYLSYSIFGYYINGVINNLHIPKNYFRNIVEYHLRAIASDKGLKLL